MLGAGLEGVLADTLAPEEREELEALLESSLERCVRPFLHSSSCDNWWEFRMAAKTFFQFRIVINLKLIDFLGSARLLETLTKFNETIAPKFLIIIERIPVDPSPIRIGLVRVAALCDKIFSDEGLKSISAISSGQTYIPADTFSRFLDLINQLDFAMTCLWEAATADERRPSMEKLNFLAHQFKIVADMLVDLWAKGPPWNLPSSDTVPNFDYDKLKKMAGTLDQASARELERIIDEGCEQVDPETW